MDVASYQEFQGLHQKYVTQKAVPVSFNVSDDLDSESYGKIVKDLLDSNFSKEVLRRDKIECPRANHHPKPTTPCCTTLEEIKKVYGVMGRFCCPTIYLVNTPEDNKLYDKILEFVRYVGLRPSVIYLDPIEDSPLSLPRLSSKRTKPSSHTRRRLYNDPGIFPYIHIFIHICFCIENELNAIICVQDDDD